jgi:phosphoglycolate phosphatase-like HAD superfamily hydrolase
LDFVEFLEDNWFAIGGMVSVIIFTIKQTKNIQKMVDNNETEKAQLKQTIENQAKETERQFKKIEDKVEKNHKELAEALDDIEVRRYESSERTRIIMNGVEATLETLHSQGANGPVTSSLKEIKEYKSVMAAKE